MVDRHGRRHPIEGLLARFWRRDGDEGLGAQGVRLVEGILCKSVQLRPALRSHLQHVESQRIVLTRNQAKILCTIGGRRRAGRPQHPRSQRRQRPQASTAVVLWLVDQTIDRDWSETIYVGLTRAKSLLAVVGSDKLAGLFRPQGGAG